MQKQQQIGVLIISTRKYKQFVQSLITQIDEYFLPEHKKVIFVFTDEYQPGLTSSHTIVQRIIPDYKFPYATLYRYLVFSQNEDELKRCSHLFYLDADMAVVKTVGNEFLTDGLVIVRHPGFYVNDGWGDSNNPPESKSYLPKEKRRHYYCGGVQGGESETYLMACKFMANGIAQDDANGIKAEWNDETFWNHYIHTQTTPEMLTEFTPSYCMVQQPHLQSAWGLTGLDKKIIALEKNHEEIRN